MRRLPFDDACAQYPHRFTMEHVPAWSRTPIATGDGLLYYGPQYRSDREWYDSTIFPGDSHQSTFTRIGAREKYCESRDQTWPLGHFLKQPYTKGQHV